MTADAGGRLTAVLRRYERLVVGLSGGADSALLAAAATSELGPEAVLCVTAVSPSLAEEELADCAALADEWGLNWETAETAELENPLYARNEGDRCFHCKAELMATLVPRAEERAATVAIGVNLDDLGDHRPGQKAAADAGAVFPLVEAGLTKKEVRELSRTLGLRTADKAAQACLASRVPYGTRVTVAVLSEVAAAESALRRLGFLELRVRHYGDLARVEVPLSSLPRLLDARAEVVQAVKSAGYRYVTVDLEGLRSGNLNAALSTPVE